jgi:MSHA biogenesis protein MshO
MNMAASMTGMQKGFTLVEAVMVIAITGIIASVVAIFIRAPIEGYFDSARRAELTDVADTAVRRFSRDVHRALPNSVRLTPDRRSIEFLLTSAGGRYRVEKDAPGDDYLDFTQNDTSFELLGPAMRFSTTTLPTGENQNQIVIYNLGIDGADAYAGNTLATHNRRTYTGSANVDVSTITIDSTSPFPFDSPSHSFHVVDTPVTYRCDLSAGVATLTRFSGYAIASSQPNPPASGGALLAQNVSDCLFTYEPGVTERSGLVSMRLSLTQNNETVTLYQEAHVSNVP